MPEPSPQAHPTAVVEGGAVVGVGVRIWHHAHVRSGATIGGHSQLGKNVFVDQGAIVGRRVKIQNNVSIYRGVTLEDDVFVGPSVVFTNDLSPRAFGDWTLTTTRVGRGASLGGGAVLLSNLMVGEFAMIGAGAVVTRDVAPHALVLGNPARPAGWVCFCGEVLSHDQEPPTTYWCGRCVVPASEP